VSTPAVWKHVVQAWQYTAGVAPFARRLDHQAGVPWRTVCSLHERTWKAWRGAPVSRRFNVRKELRRQKIEDLDVLIVEFLAGGQGFVLGHSHGAVSTWELCQPMQGDTEADGSAAKPEALVTGVFQTSRKYDVQDLCVSPPPAAQPSALLLGRSIWLASAVGQSAYVWESTGTKELGRPTSVLYDWTLRATLRHSRFMLAAHHAVWTVKLSDDCDNERYVVTVGEDCIFRAWSFGGNDGLEGTLLWQHDVGDARQVVVAILPKAAPCRNTADEALPPGAKDAPRRNIAAVARADRRSLELFHLDTGEAMDTIAEVWPPVAGSLPQAASYDTCSFLALFSSITVDGDGALACVDLGPLKDLEAMQSQWTPAGSISTSPLVRPEATPPASPPELVAPPPLSSPRVAQVVGPLAGPGRLLRFAVSIPTAEVLLAVVHEGDSREVLEVWENHAALAGERVGCACFRGRVPPMLGNPRFLAVGGRRLLLFDPTAFRTQGELRILEWQARPDGAHGAGTRVDSEARSSQGARQRPRCVPWCALNCLPQCWQGPLRLMRSRSASVV